MVWPSDGTTATLVVAESDTDTTAHTVHRFIDLELRTVRHQSEGHPRDVSRVVQSTVLPSLELHSKPFEHIGEFHSLAAVEIAERLSNVDPLFGILWKRNPADDALLHHEVAHIVMAVGDDGPRVLGPHAVPSQKRTEIAEHSIKIVGTIDAILRDARQFGAEIGEFRMEFWSTESVELESRLASARVD